MRNFCRSTSCVLLGGIFSCKLLTVRAVPRGNDLSLCSDLLLEFCGFGYWNIHFTIALNMKCACE